MLGNPDEAEDAAQEAFLKAYASLPRFRGGSSFSTWLHRIATNLCLDALRARSARRTDSWDALVESLGDGLHKLLAAPPAEPSPEDADLVRRVLDRLDPGHRAVLVLRETQGLSYAEIAEALECSLDAVKARLRRARQALQHELRHFSTSGSV